MRKEIIAIGVLVLITAGAIQAFAAGSGSSDDPAILIDDETNTITFKNFAAPTAWTVTFEKLSKSGAGSGSIVEESGSIPDITGNLHVQIDCDEEQSKDRCYECVTLPGTQEANWKVTASAGDKIEEKTITAS